MTLERIAHVALQCRKLWTEATISEAKRKKALEKAINARYTDPEATAYREAALEAQTAWNSYEAAKITLWQACDEMEKKNGQ